jgi:hypothetical protein
MAGQWAEPPSAEEDRNLALPREQTLEPAPTTIKSSPVLSIGRVGLKIVVFLVLAIILFAWWSVIVVWYVSMWILFGLFFPLFRLFRRGVRSDRAQKLRHRELLDATQHGGVNPDDLGSERVVLASPMSFTGAYRRARKIWTKLFLES